MNRGWLASFVRRPALPRARGVNQRTPVVKLEATTTPRKFLRAGYSTRFLVGTAHGMTLPAVTGRRRHRLRCSHGNRAPVLAFAAPADLITDDRHVLLKPENPACAGLNRSSGPDRASRTYPAYAEVNPSVRSQ